MIVSESRSPSNIIENDSKRRKISRRSPSSSSSDSEIVSRKRNVVSPSEKLSEKPEKSDDVLYGRTGGAYIPPARLRQMQSKITDKSSLAYQRISWEALKKSIHGLINKVNVSNIAGVVRQLLSENIIRGRGLLIRSLITSQTASPTFTHVFVALISVVNSKFPQVGELVLKRLINEFQKAFRRNQKERCLTTAQFFAHLVNQKVAHELIVLELLTLLLEQPTDDSVEVSVAVLKECGLLLSRIAPKGILGIFEHLRRILNESQCEKRIVYMLEVLFQIRRDGWKDHPTVLPELDLIDEDDQITHTLSLLDTVDTEDALNVFHFDPEFLENEEKYNAIRASFFDDSDDEDGGSGSGSDDSNAEAEEDGEGGDAQQHGAAVGASGQQSVIIDQTETNLVHLRRTIYLMLQSSISADEGAHRLLQLKIKPGEEYEVASMVLDCCAQTRSYESRFGRLAQRLCRVIIFSDEEKKKAEEKKLDGKPRFDAKTEINDPPRTYVFQFEKIFGEQYSVIHRLETAKLRNIALFYAHLLYTDSISWGVLECVSLNERDTSSSGRIFLKHLFLELCSYMGLGNLQTRLRDETLQTFFAHLLPRDNPKDTRFAINFLTTIGLGGLTLDLREFLQASKQNSDKQRLVEAFAEVSSSSSSSESSSESSSSSTSGVSSSSSSASSVSSSSSESEVKKNKKKRRSKTTKSRKADKISNKQETKDRSATEACKFVKKVKIIKNTADLSKKSKGNQSGNKCNDLSPSPPPSTKKYNITRSPSPNSPISIGHSSKQLNHETEFRETNRLKQRSPTASDLVKPFRPPVRKERSPHQSQGYAKEREEVLRNRSPSPLQSVVHVCQRPELMRNRSPSPLFTYKNERNTSPDFIPPLGNKPVAKKLPRRQVDRSPFSPRLPSPQASKSSTRRYNHREEITSRSGHRSPRSQLSPPIERCRRSKNI